MDINALLSTLLSEDSLTGGMLDTNSKKSSGLGILSKLLGRK